MYKIFLVIATLHAVNAWALINGRAAAWPEVVRLQADGEKVCTGTIIGPRTVVSAAHCATADSPFFIYNGEKYEVRYLKSGGEEQGHDVALALTDRSIKGAIFARLGQGLKHGVKVLMAGFGCTARGGKPSDLHAGENKVIGLDEDHVLAASPGGSVLCEGDSGGPVFLTDGVKRWLVGVNSLSDISKINVNVRLDSRLSRAFLRTAVRLNHLEISGF